MPSETIYSRDHQVDVRVAWGGNQSHEVQVASLATSRDPYDATDRLITIVNEWLKEAEMPGIDTVKLREKLKHAPMFDGWHASLNEWSEVNRLITVLKRARDQAFGKPE